VFSPHEVAAPGFLTRELSAAALGDPRRTRRLAAIVEKLAQSPERSFPQVLGHGAELAAFYRFVGNDDVAAADILAPHTVQTAKRCASAGARIVVAHDTTEFNYGRFPRQGLGRVGRGKAFGWYSHFSLAIEVSGEDRRVPLGVLACETFSRTGSPKPHLKHGRNQDNPDNEARRWRRCVDEVREELGPDVPVVHVMDREADDYALMAHMVERGERFVIRQYRQRAMASHDDVRDTLDGVEFVAERQVQLSPRRPSDKPAYRKRYPSRRSRTARLSFRATPVVLPRPTTASQSPLPELTLTLVHVIERDVPAGIEPVQWWLWTNETTQTPEQILAVVDAYRARWLIEEFFKALKTGCGVEQRQLESEGALHNTVALFVPIAWRLLLLRTLGTEHGQDPAQLALTPTQLVVLRKTYQGPRNRRLSAQPTVREVMMAVAALGGHLPHNGDPGWQTLAAGLQRVQTLEAGYLLAITDEDVSNQ
jgi:Transposase DNA-binding/Transposase DDE domain